LVDQKMARSQSSTSVGNDTSKKLHTNPNRSFLAAPRTALEAAVAFWLFVWFATIAAGGFFGLLVGGILGLPFGTVYAAVFGVPVLFTTAVLTWASWTWRFRVIPAVVAGAATGILATYCTFNPGFESPFVESIILAAMIGGFFSGTTGLVIFEMMKAETVSVATFRFSLSDLLIRIAVLSALLAAWLWALRTLRVLE
jgi:hypothetical protein